MPFVCGYLVKFVKDPELKMTKNGKTMCSFTVVNEEGWGDNKRKSFMRCVAFGNMANTINNHYKKGDSGLFELSYSDNPYQKNEKGYDIPNPQFILQKIHFLPKPKVTVSEDDDFVEFNASSPVAMAGVGRSSSVDVSYRDEFAPISVGEDDSLPF